MSKTAGALSSWILKSSEAEREVNWRIEWGTQSTRFYGKIWGGAIQNGGVRKPFQEKEGCPSWNPQGVDTNLLPLVIKAIKSKIMLIYNVFICYYFKWFQRKITSCIGEGVSVGETACENTGENGKIGIITLSTMWQYTAKNIKMYILFDLKYQF